MIITTGPVMTVNEADISPDIQPVGPRATPVPVKNNPSPSTTPTHRDMAGNKFNSNHRQFNNYTLCKYIEL